MESVATTLVWVLIGALVFSMTIKVWVEIMEGY